MPIFTNNAKIAAKSIDTGIVAMGIALSLEVAFDDFGLRLEFLDANPDVEFTRESFFEWLNKEETEESDEDTADWENGYEEWREEEYEAEADWQNDYNSHASHHHY